MLEILITAFFSAGLWAFLVSLSVGVLLLLTTRWHGCYSFDLAQGIQAIHTKPIPRVGGIAIYLGVMVCYLFLTLRHGGVSVGGNSPQDFSLAKLVIPPALLVRSPGALLPILGLMLFAGLPAFLFGLVEDLTKQVSVLVRLLATMISGGLASVITGYHLTHLGLPGIDSILLVAWVAIIFTAFAVGGVANAINIIDGLNGLASAVLIVAFLGLASLAGVVGDISLVWVCVVMVCAVLGFFLLNWPFGKIFLGDGGSYFGGFALAWVCVLLVERNPQISPFACLLICIYPVTEVLFSVYRRWVRKTRAGEPDRLHLHSLVHRRPLKKIRTFAGPLLSLGTIVPALAAYWLYPSTLYCILACALFVLVYIAVYARIVLHRWCSPLGFLLQQLPPRS